MRARPSHQFRSQLVEIGFRLVDGGHPDSRIEANLALCGQSIEVLHLGSLIIDDIQDGSQSRRGSASLHRLIGVPHALGVGNWLYFYALRLLENLELSAERKLQLMQHYHRIVEWAHYGQVLDLCIKVDEVPWTEVAQICEQCLSGKTGSLVNLALVMGAMIGGATAKKIEAIGELGRELGVYLQRWNDLGNVVSASEGDKRFEDLLSRKPSFVWAFVCKHYGEKGFKDFYAAVEQLPRTDSLELWLDQNALAHHAGSWIEESFDTAIDRYLGEIAGAWHQLEALGSLRERIRKAYV
jgi:geranylgeranyl pyrophosphate synthase